MEKMDETHKIYTQFLLSKNKTLGFKHFDYALIVLIAVIKGIFAGLWFPDNVKFNFIIAKRVENFLMCFWVDEFVIKTKDYDE
jgi:hypothetical protein